MWKQIAKYFNKYPKRRIIAQKLLEYGLRIEKNSIYCGKIDLSDSTCHLKDVAPDMKWGVIEIIPEDPSIPGILAGVANIVADAKLSIRQAIVDDFELSEEPRLYIVVEKQVPGILIPKIRNVKGVKAVVIY